MLLSILCHIWKIVPDLYEAIIHLSEDTSGSDGNDAKVNISEINYQLNPNNNSYREYEEANILMYLEDSNGALEDILIAEGGGYLSISNCSDIFFKIEKHYNITGFAIRNFFKNDEAQQEVVVEVRYNSLSKDITIPIT